MEARDKIQAEILRVQQKIDKVESDKEILQGEISSTNTKQILQGEISTKTKEILQGEISSTKTKLFHVRILSVTPESEWSEEDKGKYGNLNILKIMQEKFESDLVDLCKTKN